MTPFMVRHGFRAWCAEVRTALKELREAATRDLPKRPDKLDYENLRDSYNDFEPDKETLLWAALQMDDIKDHSYSNEWQLGMTTVQHRLDFLASLANDDARVSAYVATRLIRGAAVVAFVSGALVALIVMANFGLGF